MRGKVIAQTGTLTYVIEVGPNKFVKRHFDQLISVAHKEQEIVTHSSCPANDQLTGNTQAPVSRTPLVILRRSMGNDQASIDHTPVENDSTEIIENDSMSISRYDNTVTSPHTQSPNADLTGVHDHH